MQIGGTQDAQRLAAEDNVAFRGVDILVYADNLGHLFLQPLGQMGDLAEIALGGDESDQRLVEGRADADRQIAQQAAFFYRIVNIDFLPRHLFLHRADNAIDQRMVNRTIADIDDIMRATTIQADAHLPAFTAEGELGIGPVALRPIRRTHRVPATLFSDG